MPNIFRRIFWSNSSASQHDREDEEVEDEVDPEPATRREEGMQVIPSSERRGQPGDFARNETHARSIDRGYDPTLEWQSRVTKRITTLIKRLKYNKKKPKWVPDNWWENLKTRPEDPTFDKYSKTNTTNRKSGDKDGKTLGTHTLGRKSCSDAFKELGQEAIPYKLFTKTKKNKKGEWVNPRAVEIDHDYNEEMSQPLPPGQSPDELQAYYKPVKGFDKKNRIFGTRAKGAEIWYNPPTDKASRRSFSYAPSMISQIFTQMNDERAARIALEKTVREQAEQMAAMQKAWADMQAFQTPNTCSQFNPHRRDDFADD
ncbi:uncharacterized protein LOC141588491 [Silene latifolia]|uniref:uncharacterized protein LOC141588491 n=1 Tax=Silene latifolia TaxID=37657 RepID=UPI003D77D9CC